MTPDEIRRQLRLLLRAQGDGRVPAHLKALIRRLGRRLAIADGRPAGEWRDVVDAIRGATVSPSSELAGSANAGGSRMAIGPAAAGDGLPGGISSAPGSPPRKKTKVGNGHVVRRYAVTWRSTDPPPEPAAEPRWFSGRSVRTVSGGLPGLGRRR